MAKARIDANGDLINSETGEVIGNVRDGVNFNSSGSRLRTLEEAGVSLPEFPDEESSGIEENGSASMEGRNEAPAVQRNVDAGISSFRKDRTKYEVTRDTYFVVRFGLMQKGEGGRFIVIGEQDVPEHRGAEPHWVKFRMWSYDEELSWKSNCMEYSAADKCRILNINKLNEQKLKMLLLDWSFGECDDRLKLLHCDGRLSDESYCVLKCMYPAIVNAIIDLMNNVLENNQ